MQEELEVLLIQKDYNKDREITIEILKNMDRDKIENWIAYKNILEFRVPDEGYYENYVKPLTNELVNEFSELKDYIRQVCIINEALRSIYDKLERDFIPYRRGSMFYAAYIIACKYEEFLHDLNFELNKYKEDKDLQTIKNIYQANVDKCIHSFNRMVKMIYNEKDNFLNNKKYINIYQFISDIENESKSDFINNMCRLNSIEDVLNMIKAKDVSVNSYDGNEFVLKYSYSNIIKNELPKIRQKNFDDINFRKHAKDIPVDFKLLDAKDIQQYVEINQDAFRLKIDFLSNEFKVNINTTLLDIQRFFDLHLKT